MYAGFMPKEIDEMGLDDIQLYMTLISKRKEQERDLIASGVSKGFGGK
jgi:hypothetical protein